MNKSTSDRGGQPRDCPNGKRCPSRSKPVFPLPRDSIRAPIPWPRSIQLPSSSRPVTSCTAEVSTPGVSAGPDANLPPSSVLSPPRSRTDGSPFQCIAESHPPAQYCEFGGTAKKCEDWLKDEHEDLWTRLYSEGLLLVPPHPLPPLPARYD